MENLRDVVKEFSEVLVPASVCKEFLKTSPGILSLD